MKLTFSVDDWVVDRARRVARSMDKGLNQLVREYLEQLAGPDQVEADCAELRRLSAVGSGRPQGRRVDRDELHERS
jgi:hypothetical protein